MRKNVKDWLMEYALQTKRTEENVPQARFFKFGLNPDE